MKHAVTYLVAALLITALAVCVGGWALLLLWPAVACLLVGLGYAGLGVAVFGKRRDGRLAPWAWLCLLPYLAFTWAWWRLKRKISTEPLYHEVAPGLWVGRRVLGGELPRGVQLVVDVTCEFAEPSSVLQRCEYRALPILNYGTPRKAALLALVSELEAREGLYIHCAQGHGRSATVAAALLMHRGRVAGWAEAVEEIVRVRPKAHLEPCQEQFLREL